LRRIFRLKGRKYEEIDRFQISKCMNELKKEKGKGNFG